MSKYLVAVFVLAIVLSDVSCRVLREAPSKPETTVSEVFDEVTNQVKAFQDTLMEILGVKNTEELQKKATDTGKEIAQKFDSLASDIKKETEEFKNSPAVKGLQETIDKTIEDIKAKNPETTEELKSFYEKAAKGTEEIVDKIKAFSDSEDAHKLKDLSKKLLETASNTIQNIAQDVKENLKTQ